MGAPDIPVFDTAMPMSQTDIQKRVDIQSAHTDVMDYFQYGIPAMLTGAGQDLANGTFWDVDETQIAEKFKELGMDNFAQFYAKHHEGARLLGSVATSFIPIIGATKLFRAGNMIDKAFRHMGRGGEIAQKLLISSGKTMRERVELFQRGNYAKFLTDRAQHVDDIAAAVRGERLAAAGDFFKESLAAEAVLYGLYYDEKTAAEGTNPFYTDSLMQNFLFAAVPTAAFSAGAYGITGRRIYNWLASDAATEVAKAVNIHGVDVASAVSRSGGRGIVMAAHAQVAAGEREFLAANRSVPATKNAAGRKEQAENAVREQANVIANDAYFGQMLTPKAGKNPLAGEIETVVMHAVDEPSSMIGIVGLSRFSDETSKSFPQMKKVEIKRRVEALQNARIEGASTQELQKMISDLDELIGSSHIVLETDGTISSLEGRVWSSIDDVQGMHAVAEEDVLKVPNAIAQQLGMQVGVDSKGKVYAQLSAAAEEALSKQRNAFEIVPPNKVDELKTKLLLTDMADTWKLDSQTSLGHQVWRNLAPEMREALDAWKGTSNSQLREWVYAHPEKIDQIQEAFRANGFHARLAELADEQGFITLFRGQMKGETANPTNKLISMSTNPRTAKAFTGGSEMSDIIKMSVHIDDVVAPIEIGNLREFEFIVKNGDKRINLATEAKMRTQFNSHSYPQRMAVYTLAQKQLMKTDAATPLAVSGKDNFVTIDFALEVMNKAETEGRFSNVTLIDNAGNRLTSTSREAKERLQFLSLSKKFEAYQDLMRARDAAENGIVKLPTLSDHQIAQMLNLPTSYAYGKHPLLEVFNSAMSGKGQANRSLFSMFNSMDEVKDAMRAFTVEGNLSEARQQIEDFVIVGNSLRHDKDLSLKPALAHYSKSRLQERMDAGLLNKLIGATKMMNMDKLANVNPKEAPLIKTIMDLILANPEQYALASQVDRLIQGTQAGVGKISTQAFNLRGIPTGQAADDMAGTIKRIFQKNVSKTFESVTPVFGRLAATNNKGSLLATTVAMNALRKGWRVMDDVVEVETGKFAFKLDKDDARNARFWKEAFGEVPEKDEELFLSIKGENGQPERVIVDELALEGLTAITQLSHQYLDHVNTLRRIRGMNEINKLNWHVPFYDMTKTNQVYLTDLSGRVVQQISGATQQQAEQLATKELARHAEQGKHYAMKTTDQLQDHFSSVHAAWEPPTNFGMSSKQTGGKTGKTQTEIIETDADVLKNVIHQLQNNYDSIFRYTMGTAFESELDYARRAAASLPSQVARQRKETIFDMYERAILQKASLNKETALGATYGGIESGINRGLAGLWDAYTRVVPSSVKASQSDFDALLKATGGELPFSDLTDMIARTQKVHVPPTARSVFDKFNRFSTNMVLRVLDMGMVAVNFASLMSTMPAVMKAMQRMPQETLEAWKARTAIYGTHIGDDFTMPNPMRFAMDAMHEFWQPETRKALKRAAELGLFDQEAAERLTYMTEPFETWREQILRKGIDVLSLPTDWSEKMSRYLSFSMGFSFAKKSMQLTDDAAIMFAHKMANSVVGDYRTINRPQIFQGAAGMPFGLFTTWVWNLLQRVYGDLEGGRMGAVAMQGILQELLFGAESMPGSEFFIEQLTTSYDGKTNIVDKLDKAFGHDWSDFIMSGGLSSATGIAFQSRADVTLPAFFSGAPLSQKAPALGVATQLVEGTKEMLHSIITNGGLNTQDATEIVSIYGVNGFVKNMAQLAQGYSVDRARNLIEEDTRTLQNVTARLIELKTQQEHRKINELRRDAVNSQMYADRISNLQTQLLTSLRSGDLDSETMEGILGDYIKAGGSPEHFKQFVRRAAIKSQVEKPFLQMLEKIRQSNDENGMARYMLMYDEKSE